MPATISKDRYLVKRFLDNLAQYSFDMREKVRSDYGSRLLAARTEAGLTQTALAKAVGMSQSALVAAESTGQGSTYTSQLAAVCGVRAEWLATGEGPKREPATDVPAPPQTDLNDADRVAEAIEVITKALMNVDDFTRDFVRHSLSRLGKDPSESGNISHKIADLLVKNRSESGSTDTRPRSVGKLIGGSALKDIGGTGHGRGDTDAAQGGRKG